jgi:hypothetical protein
MENILSLTLFLSLNYIAVNCNGSIKSASSFTSFLFYTLNYSVYNVDLLSNKSVWEILIHCNHKKYLLLLYKIRSYKIEVCGHLMVAVKGCFSQMGLRVDISNLGSMGGRLEGRYYCRGWARWKVQIRNNGGGTLKVLNWPGGAAFLISIWILWSDWHYN